MTSLPLEVDEVLEQEYEALHGDLGARPAAEYRAEDILDPGWAAGCLTACGFSGETLAVINDIVRNDADGEKLEKLTKSPAISDKGLHLIDIYTRDVGSPQLRRRIVDEALCGAVKAFRDVNLGALYGKLHDKRNAEARSALCISGGGIRSATFALGVIQGLASAGVLNKFHYLSTVSGGGYIGSWLSSWARRHSRGISGVQDDLVRADTGIRQQIPARGGEPAPRELPETKIDPEPQPLRHLRDYSNYLSPKLGFLSADTWTMAALYLRNLMLNLLVLIPILAAILALPRLFENLLHWRRAFDAWDFGATVLALGIGFGYIGAARPVKHGRDSAAWLNTNSWFFILCVIPLTVAGFGLALFWAQAAENKALLAQGKWWGIAAVAVMILVPCVIYYVRYANASFAERRQAANKAGVSAGLKKVAFEAAGAATAAVTAAGLFLLLAVKAFPHPLAAVPNPMALPVVDRVNVGMPIAEIFTCFAVPLVLLIFFVQASIFVGISSRFNEDNDREWWGRAGAYLLMVAVLGGLAAFISVFGPVLLYRAPIILGSIGGVSGLAAGLLGYSAGTPATDKKKKQKKETASGALLGLAAPLFALVLLAAISLGTTVLLQLLWYDTDVKQVTKDAQFVSTVSQTTTDGGYARKDETGKLPLASVEVTRGFRHLERVHQTDRQDLILIFVLAAVAAALSRFIGANRFSMHGLYRNRLIRAYLGASRYSRDPDRFTGFDENDNLQMYELRPELLWPNSFTDACAFVQQIAEKQSSGIEKQIWETLGSKIQKQIVQHPKSSAIAAAVIQKVNVLMQTIDLTTGASDGSSVSLLRRNRDVLEATFPTLKKLGGPRAPLHVVNTCLNLTGGEKLAWQQRKAESFTISPLHCGSLYIGYRDAREYGGDDGISLGTAVTISGAAASPNQGYHSSMPLAFILTLLNVRLGSWLGNPGLAGENTYTMSNPRSNLETLAHELAGDTNDECSWIYLSDGGHFENLALYEMVLRRCRYIVLTDGGCDPKFSFEDLGNAIRKIRTDLGVPIDIENVDMFPRPEPGAPLRNGSYVTTATIRYSAVDGNSEEADGTLVYLKPSVYDETFFPRDVYNYAQESPTFPHETTADQFFSESQFESYRALGRHVIDVIRGNSNAVATTYPTMEQFVEDVQGRARQIAHRAKENALGVAISAGTGEIASAIRGLTPPAAVPKPPMLLPKTPPEQQKTT